MVCGGTGCISSSSDQLIVELKKELKVANYDKEISVIKTGCFGFCGEGPIPMPGSPGKRIPLVDRHGSAGSPRAGHPDHSGAQHLLAGPGDVYRMD